MLKPTVVESQMVTGSVPAATDVQWQPVDSDGDPADPGVVVSVQVASSDGTELIAKETTDGTGSDPRTIATLLTLAQKATVDWLIATWTDPSDNVLAVTTHELIGAPLLTLADYKRFQPNNSASVDADVLRPVRREVDEAMCRGHSSWLNRSVLPRFQVELYETDYRVTDRLLLHYPDLRRVAWARTLNADGTTTSITVTGIKPDPLGHAVLPNATWPIGARIEIGYEHGYPQPPEDVKRMAAKEIYARLGGQSSAIDARARTYQDALGNTLTFNEVGTRHRVSDVEGVNQLVRDHRWDVPGVA